MKSVSVHKDFFDVIKEHSVEDIGLLFLALAADVEDAEAPELSPSLAVIRKLINQQNQRFSKQQSEKRKPNPPKEPKIPDEPKQPTVPDTVPASVPISDSEERENGADAPTHEEKHKRGQFGWVKLTDSEYQRLIGDFGEDIARHYIAYVDESAQQTGNKNKWKDWNLTVRKAIKNKWGGLPDVRGAPKPEHKKTFSEIIAERHGTG